MRSGRENGLYVSCQVGRVPRRAGQGRALSNLARGALRWRSKFLEAYVMHNRFSRTLTALVIVLGLWSGSLTALASALPAQQAGQQTSTSAKQGSGDEKAQKEQKAGDETAEAEAQPSPAPAGS